MNLCLARAQLLHMPSQFPSRSLVRALANVLAAVLVSFLVVLAGQVIVEGVPQTLWWVEQRTASVCVTLIYVALLFSTLRFLLSFWPATLILGLAVGLFSYANKLKLLKLGVPISPSDLTLSHQYLSVARILWGDAALWGLYLLAAILLAAAAHFRNAIARWIRTRGMNWLGGAGCALVAFALIYIPDFSGQSSSYRSVVPKLLAEMSVINYNWVPNHNLQLNGQILSFIFNVRTALLEPPSDYSRDSILRGLGQLAEPRQSVVGGDQAPDIVVIMNEAFWDPSGLPGVKFSDPLLSKLKATARGQMFSPVFGGYTANTEFEFLTRLSTAYLPSGAIPYTQFVRRPLPSLATALRSAGYSATAVHPFERTFYQRDRVYRELGFERFIARDEFSAPKNAGPFVTDMSVAHEIATLIDASPQQKHFVFAVTMQNHGAYTGDDTRYPEGSRVPIALDGVSLSAEAEAALQTYATGVRDGVDFFNEVVRYFEERRRRAVVVMFGDHLPGLGDDYGVYRETGFVASSTRDEWSSQDYERMHTVPVVGWTNASGALHLPQQAISPIYFSTLVKRAAGVDDDVMDRLLDRVQGEYDVLTSFYSRGPNGASSQGVPPETDTTRLYRNIEYDLLVGNQYAVPFLLEAPKESVD